MSYCSSCAALQRELDAERAFRRKRESLHDAELTVICAASIVVREGGHPHDIAELRKALMRLTEAEIAYAEQPPTQPASVADGGKEQP